MRPLRLAVTAVLCLAAAFPAGARAATRPHSRVVTYDRGDMRVTRLQLALHRSGGLLRGRVSLSAHSTNGRASDFTLRLGRCVSGALYLPTCPAAYSLAVHVPATGTARISHLVTLRQPPARIDAVEATLVTPGSPPTLRWITHARAELLVRGRAWRGALAGRTFGLLLTDAPGAAVGRLSFDGPAVRPDELYADAVFTASGSDVAGITTRLRRCNGPTCTLTTLKNRRGSGDRAFGDRFAVHRDGADTFGLQVSAPGGAPLADVLLPWPV